MPDPGNLFLWQRLPCKEEKKRNQSGTQLVFMFMRVGVRLLTACLNSVGLLSEPLWYVRSGSSQRLHVRRMLPWILLYHWLGSDDWNIIHWILKRLNKGHIMGGWVTWARLSRVELNSNVTWGILLCSHKCCWQLRTAAVYCHSSVCHSLTDALP